MWKCNLLQSLWKAVWRFLKKLELELSYDPAITLLAIHITENIVDRDMCLLSICCLLWINVCLFLWPIFLLGHLFIWTWGAGVTCIFLTLVLFSCFICYYFLPFWRLSFYLAYKFVCCAEDFNFDEVPFVYFCFYFQHSGRWVTEDPAVIYVEEGFAYVLL